MGKRSREKKMQRLSQEQQEKELILQRREQRLAGTMLLVRKFALTFTATVILLWIGVVITGKLGLIGAFSMEGM